MYILHQSLKSEWSWGQVGVFVAFLLNQREEGGSRDVWFLLLGQLVSLRKVKFINSFFLLSPPSLSCFVFYLLMSAKQVCSMIWGQGDKLRGIKAWCFELNCNDCVCVVKVWWDKRRISSNSASWAGNSAAKGPGYDTVNCFLLITLMWVLRVKFVGSSPG